MVFRSARQRKAVMARFRVLLDMRPVEGPDIINKSVPLQNLEGTPRTFKSKGLAIKAFKKSGVGFFDRTGKFVDFKHKIVRVR